MTPPCAPLRHGRSRVTALGLTLNRDAGGPRARVAARHPAPPGHRLLPRQVRHREARPPGGFPRDAAPALVHLDGAGDGAFPRRGEAVRRRCVFVRGRHPASPGRGARHAGPRPVVHRRRRCIGGRRLCAGGRRAVDGADRRRRGACVPVRGLGRAVARSLADRERLPETSQGTHSPHGQADLAGRPHGVAGAVSICSPSPCPTIGKICENRRSRRGGLHPGGDPVGAGGAGGAGRLYRRRRGVRHRARGHGQAFASIRAGPPQHRGHAHLSVRHRTHEPPWA